MEEKRMFCRFQPARWAEPGLHEIPPDGFCVDVFLLLRRSGSPGEVLLGRIAPAAEWTRVGALIPETIPTLTQQWVLPASHFLWGEGPGEAARRVAREQLGLSDWSPPEPRVLSEVYPSARNPAGSRHWDLQFLHEGEVPAAALRPPPGLWTELRFVPAVELPSLRFGRNHDDLLRWAEIWPAPGS